MIAYVLVIGCIVVAALAGGIWLEVLEKRPATGRCCVHRCTTDRRPGVPGQRKASE